MSFGFGPLPPVDTTDLDELPNSHGGSFVTGLINAIRSGATLPGDVYAGRTDPRSDEGIARATDLAGLAMTGGVAGTGPGGVALGSGPVRQAPLLMDEASRMGRAAEQGFNTGETFYHGSATPFPNFRPGRTNDSTHEAHPTPAVFMTSDPALASQYAQSASKGRMEDVADLYTRNGRDVPWDRYMDTRSGGDTEKAARALLAKAAQAIPDSVEHADVLRGIVSRYPMTDLKKEAFSSHLGNEVADKVFSFRKAAYDTADAPTYHKGAQVYPLLGPSNVMDVDSGFFGGSFNGIMFDKLLGMAKEQGRQGLRIRNVVDSPTGTGNPADVMAVFNPADIRSRFAAFDPRLRGSSGLLAGGAGAAILPFGFGPPQEQE